MYPMRLQKKEKKSQKQKKKKEMYSMRQNLAGLFKLNFFK